ncbi:MAG: SRPBCC family protein [Dehalococcoidia bacterium]
MAEAKTERIVIDLPDDLSIGMTRRFRAPKRLVFEAHVNPQHLKNWWGRTGSTLSVCEIDARAGGKWRFVERQANGEEYGFHGEFREVTPPDRIVWTFEFEGAPGNVAVETVTFTEADGVTTLRTISVADSKEARDAMLQSGMEEGANESLDRLEELLRNL